MSTFKDYFSKQATGYSKYRPDYPPELFRYLASLVDEHNLALDCATGNGQAAIGIAEYFDNVVAIDASRDQIANAMPHERIAYLVAPAEKIPLEEHQVNLFTIAQALHWLNFEKFFVEVRRVVKPGGIFAAWLYVGSTISPELDPLIRRYEFKIVGPYWPPERKLVDEKYQTIPFPFQELPSPSFSLEKHWTLEEYLGYLDTWSATQKFIEKNQFHPLTLIEDEITKTWGNPSEQKLIRWPLYFRIGRVQ